LELDLDASGGSGASQFFEGFESGTYGQFAAMNLDAGRANLEDSDGYRCQYSDPDRPGSNNYASGFAAECHLGSDPAQAEAFYWRIDGADVPDEIDGGRSFNGEYSLHYGIPANPDSGFTTPFAALEAIRTTEPINIGLEASELSFLHQVSIVDNRGEGDTGPDVTLDRAIVQVQLADDNGAPAGPWVKLHPAVNPYESQAADIFFECSFDPVDDGNDEDSVVIGAPRRDDAAGGAAPHLLGPSSTCYPEYAYAHQGDTDEPFAPSNIGSALHGPGLQGVTGTGTWVETRFGLESFRGRRIRLRFLFTSIKVLPLETWASWFGTQSTPADDGWWIDDVRVTDTLDVPVVLAVDTKDNSALPVP
jgi:hypothetical protein